jgi:hypothetical protein
MFLITGIFAAALGAQPLDLPTPRPAVECAEHLTNWGARRNCLRGLLNTAEDALDDAADAAREEADEVDADLTRPSRPGSPIAMPSARAGLRPCSCPPTRERKLPSTARSA